jgi:hypothetical protein
LWVDFALLDPDPDSESTSTDLIESSFNPDPDPKHSFITRLLAVRKIRYRTYRFLVKSASYWLQKLTYHEPAGLLAEVAPVAVDKRPLQLLSVYLTAPAKYQQITI